MMNNYGQLSPLGVIRPVIYWIYLSNIWNKPSISARPSK